MPRNINRRVETLFPLEDEALIQHVKNDLLSVYLADTAKARRMNSDGTYTRLKANGEPRNAQDWFVEQAKSSKRPR